MSQRGAGCPNLSRPGARAPFLLIASFFLAAGTVLVCAHRSAAGQPKELTPEVLRAIRLLLSDDPKDEERGERELKHIGKPAIPQLRHWVGKVRGEAGRVEAVLTALEGKEPEPYSAERMPAGEFFDKKLLECRSLLRRGEYRQVAELSEAILLLHRSYPGSWELRKLARKARERLASREMLEPMIEVEKLVYEAGEDPLITFRVVNRDSRIARIRLDKGVLGEMDMVVTQHLLSGVVKRDENKLRIQVPQEVEQIIIGPAQSWDQPLDFPQGKDISPSGAVARVQIAGRFRPRRWTVERAGENIAISMGESEFWIVPKGEAPLCERPLEKLTAAIFFGKLEPFFVGGQLCVWAGEEDPYFNEKFVTTLIENLEDLDAPRRTLAHGFLVQATGQELSSEPKEWLQWWARRSASPSPPAPEKSAEK
jgi:hypothetical protein